MNLEPMNGEPRNGEPMNGDPEVALGALAGNDDPWLIGVRHHSPACAAAMPALLAAFRPELILLELPPELGSWLPWLSHEELMAPVALAAASAEGHLLSFFPFADFSPELAALRWARANAVPVEPFDLPLHERGREAQNWSWEGPSLLAALKSRCEAEDVETLWERLVEARAPGAEPEAIRRAALLAGWMLRLEEARSGAGIDGESLRRETHMRQVLAARQAEGLRIVAVVGAFHAAALLAEPLLFEPRPSAEDGAGPGEPTVTSLIPYSTELLDSRSGYPAGIRDPLWQQGAFEALRDGVSPEPWVGELVARVGARLRAANHVAGVPDLREALRLAIDLARLRDLPAAGRRELLEGIETALGQGELWGRGRVLARALEHVLVGRQRGRLAAGTPRSGLAPHVEALLAELGLPGPGSSEPKKMRLDPLRSRLDARRRVTLMRLRTCGIPYGELREADRTGSTAALTEVWEVSWTPATAALLELAAVAGSTLEQATVGALRRQEREKEQGATARDQLAFLTAAAECALLLLTRERLARLLDEFEHEAGLAEVIEALELVDRIARGHFPGLDPDQLAPDPPLGAIRAELLAATIRAVEGLAGSERPEDVLALLEVIRLFGQLEEENGAPGAGRLGWALDQLALLGSPLIQGAAGAARVLTGREESRAFGARAGSWVEGGQDGPSRLVLAKRLQGALMVAAPLFEADGDWAAGLIERIEALSDDDFLERLPALREGFSVLSPAARERLLEALESRLPDVRELELEVAPEQLALFVEADREGAAAMAAIGEVPRDEVRNQEPLGSPAAPEAEPGATVPKPEHSLGAADRWRLILGRQQEKLPPGRAQRAARALEDLYGAGSGEGSRALWGGGGGGRETAFPGVREWAEELQEVFGESVREEVLGLAAAHGNMAAALALDPEKVLPSIELLEQVLSLRGGLPEAQLQRLRRLVKRVVDQLVEVLAVRLRPALAGLTVARPTRVDTGRLDLRRTLAANLNRLSRTPEGAIRFAPEKLIFRQRGRRSVDWKIILVVDVSGSMEASVIYSAMMAAILSGLPALSVHFVAFSTEILDLSNRVGDPLGLLLEITVGGGTHLARGLAYARSLMKVPSRTLVVAITDFEEGFPVENLLAEVRELVDSGAKVLGLAALDDRGQPRYHRGIAERVVAAGMPVAALTPLELARWVGERIR